MVGDATGIDSAAAALLPQARIFQVGAHGSPRAPYRAQLVARSVACVQACARAGGVWCAFPGRPAPAALVPSRSSAKCFGHGSGTWSSLALALSLAPLMLSRSMAPVVAEMRPAIVMAVLIALAAIVFIGDFNFATRPLGIVYIGGCLAAIAGAAALLAFDRAHRLQAQPQASRGA